MKPETTARRTLSFASLDEAVRDAEMLLAKGYDKAGQWSLGQCCGHLANWLSYPMDGFPKAPPPIRLMLWLARHSIGPGKLKQYLATGDMVQASRRCPKAYRPRTPTIERVWRNTGRWWIGRFGSREHRYRARCSARWTATRG